MLTAFRMTVRTVHVMFSPLNCRGGCYFWLDPKVTKTERSEIMSAIKKQLNTNNSRQKNTSTRSAGS